MLETLIRCRQLKQVFIAALILSPVSQLEAMKTDTDRSVFAQTQRNWGRVMQQCMQFLLSMNYR